MLKLVPAMDNRAWLLRPASLGLSLKFSLRLSFKLLLSLEHNNTYTHTHAHKIITSVGTEKNSGSQIIDEKSGS